jgi:hypothetical protein
MSENLVILGHFFERELSEGFLGIKKGVLEVKVGIFGLFL